MKNLKKVLASLVVVAMMASMAIMPAFAETFNYQAEAEKLYAVGLYKGISTDPNNPDLDLATLLDRQTGVVMLLRLFGQEEEAKLLSDEQANSLLAKFSDAGTIADWAKRQVAYAVEKGFVKGYEDSTFRPTAGLNGKAYASLLLQQLGYDGDFDYHQAAIKLSQVGGLTASQATTFNSDAQLNKDALVGISYGALQAKFKADGKKVIKALIESKYVDEEKVKEAGIPYADIVSVAEIADVTVDIGGTPTLPATVTATYDNGTTAEVAVTWPTVDTSAAGEFEITGTIADTDVTAKVKVIVMPAELRVAGSTSGNRRELILNFNRPVGDADKAKDVGSYKVKKNEVINAELSEDKMTVTLLVKDTIANQSDVEVTVKKDVGLKEDATVTIENVKDVSAPEVASVEAIGNTYIRVTYTEPVQTTAKTGSNYTIDGKSFAASKIEMASNEKVVNITLKNALSDGEHKLVVKNKVSDFAGFAIEDNETTFTVVEDKEAPTGEVESATQTKVVIKFSEPVKTPDEDDVYTNTKAEIEKLELSDDGTTYTITFSLDDPLPASGGKITIDNLSDYSGNKTDFVVTVKPDYDEENPEIVGYEIKDNQTKIVIEFSEDVYDDSGDYELLNADGDEVAISSPEYEKDKKGNDIKNKIVITKSGGEEFASGKYKLTVKGVEDLTPMRNQLEKTTLTIEIDDEKAPSIEKVYENTIDNILYITFNEDVDEDSVTDLDNYTVDLGEELVDLDSDNVDDIELLSDDRTVAITFADIEDGIVIAEDEIKRIIIENVKDTAGNEAKRLIATDEEFDSIGEAPYVDEANVTGENTIVLHLVGKINGKTLSPDDFIINYEDAKGDVKTLEPYDAEYDSSKDEIKLLFSKDFSTDGKYEGSGLVLTIQEEKKIDTTDVFNQKLELDEESIIDDGIAVGIAVGDKFNPSISSIAKATKVTGDDEGVYAEIEISEELALTGIKAAAEEEEASDALKEVLGYEEAWLLKDFIASQFTVTIGSDRVDVEVYYVEGGEDNKNTKGIDESKPRLVIVASGEYSKKSITIDFNPLPNTEKNEGKLLLDIEGNTLGAKKGMTKTIVKK